MQCRYPEFHAFAIFRQLLPEYRESVKLGVAILHEIDTNYLGKKQ